MFMVRFFAVPVLFPFCSSFISAAFISTRHKHVVFQHNTLHVSYLTFVRITPSFSTQSCVCNKTRCQSCTVATERQRSADPRFITTSLRAGTKTNLTFWHPSFTFKF
jgi:hypothetical protein